METIVENMSLCEGCIGDIDCLNCFYGAYISKSMIHQLIGRRKSAFQKRKEDEFILAAA